MGSSSPSHPLWEFQRLSQPKLDDLISKAPSLEVADCDPSVLSASQLSHYTAVKSRSPVVKVPLLQKRLTSLTPPVYYLDFEAVGMLEPPYGGMRPYETYVTQYSVHVSESAVPGGEGALLHREYLAEPRKDCRGELAGKLVEDLGDKGSIVVYSPYER